MEAVTPDLAARFELADGAKGLVGTAVDGGSPAEEAGMRPGYLVLKVNRETIRSLADYRAALDRNAQGNPVLFLLQRGQNTFFVAIRPKP